jgi:plastocyanin
MVAGKESREETFMLRLTTAFSVCLLTSLAAGCTREGPAYAPKPADVAAVVEMTNAFFSPEAVRIPVGGTVEWRNTSITTHTVTADPSRIHDPEQGALPAGAVPPARARSGGASSGGTLSPCPGTTATPATRTTTSSA